MPGPEEREFLVKFKQEAEEHIQGLNRGLLELESDPRNQETVNELFRLAHTLKGASRMVGLTEIGNLAHEVENTFGRVRDEGVALAGSEINDLFRSFDRIKELLENVVPVEEKIPESTEFCIVPKPEAGNLATEAQVSRDGSSAVQNRERLPKSFGRRLEDREETIRVRTERLDKMASIVSELIIGNMQIEQCREELKNVYLKSKKGLGFLVELRERLQNVGAISAQNWEAFLPEFTQTYNAYADLSNYLHGLNQTFAENISRVARIAQDLQQEVLDVRMLPISIILDSVPRAVRDMAQEFDKLIRIRISGGETELDKRMLEGLKDPFMHLIRNAVDHGIEAPEERESMGKPREGLLEICAWQEGDKIVAEIKDDGAGIDWEGVRQAALEKGFSPEIVNGREEQGLMDLLFLPGFSTNESVTSVSGRGVGLDVVKRNVEDLKGTVSIFSERGKGSTIRLEIPLTLAIQRVLLVEVGKEIIALPTTAIEETFTLNPEHIRTIEGRQTVSIRERIIPLVSLGKILELNGSSVQRKGKLVSILVSWNNQEIAFLVDGLVGEQEVVVKSLGNYLTGIRNVAGATILGSGEVVVILDVSDLIESSRSTPGTFSPPKEEQKAGEARAGNHHSILVVEDSLTTREMEKSILETSGFEVDIAADGAEALEKAARKRYDLFVIDIEMPRMDGFQLTERLRKGQSYKEVPIIMVTSQEKDEDKKRGFDLGADAYIVKRHFDQKLLLDTVGRLIG